MYNNNGVRLMGLKHAAREGVFLWPEMLFGNFQVA